MNCLHCQRTVKVPTRGLCKKCYRIPSIKSQYGRINGLIDPKADWRLIDCHSCKETLFAESMRGMVLSMSQREYERATAEYKLPGGQAHGFTYCRSCWAEMQVEILTTSVAHREPAI